LNLGTTHTSGIKYIYIGDSDPGSILTITASTLNIGSNTAYATTWVYLGEGNTTYQNLTVTDVVTVYNSAYLVSSGILANQIDIDASLIIGWSVQCRGE